MGALWKPRPQLLLNERGAPVPPPELMVRLGRISPNLGVRFMPDMDRSRFAVTWEWPEADTRWERVRSQEISRESAYDIVGYLPLDCSLEESASYIERHLKAYPKDEVQKLHREMHRWNTVEVPKQQVAEIVTAAVDDMARSQRKPNPRRKKATLEGAS